MIELPVAGAHDGVQWVGTRGLKPRPNNLHVLSLIHFCYQGLKEFPKIHHLPEQCHHLETECCSDTYEAMKDFSNPTMASLPCAW